MGELGIALAAGGLTTLNPCVFPILPLVVGASLQEHRIAPVAMGIGMALAFALLGLATGLLAESTEFDSDSIRNVSALLMVLFGTVIAIPQTKDIFSRIISPMANQASALSSKLDGGSSKLVLPRALLMGMLLGFVWTPCSGPLLASTLSLAASGGAASATLTLALFGLGAAIPLISVGYLSRSTLGRVREWVILHGARAQQIMGVLLAAVGLMVFFAWDKAIEASIIRLLPDSWTRFTTMF